MRMLHTSGIGPVRPDGSVPEGLEPQAEVVWSTILALLAEAELAVTDLVSVTTYVVIGDDRGQELGDRLGRVMGARDAALDGHRCASILVPVPALAAADWNLEIAVVAVGS